MDSVIWLAIELEEYLVQIDIRYDEIWRKL